jgi:hypothetical protein
MFYSEVVFKPKHYKKPFRFYVVQINNHKFQFTARSRAEALNIARFKFCFSEVKHIISNCLLVDLKEFKQLYLDSKEFEFMLFEGDLITRPTLRETEAVEKLMLKDVRMSRLLEDAKNHERSLHDVCENF